MTLKWGVAYLYMSHHCLSQSPPLSRAGWQSLGSAPAQTRKASGKTKYMLQYRTSSGKLTDSINGYWGWYFLRVMTRHALLLNCSHWRSTVVPRWRSIKQTRHIPRHTQALCTETDNISTRSAQRKLLLKYEMRSTLTLLGDEVCEDAVQRATVCQVIQGPGTVWYEERLIAGP